MNLIFRIFFLVIISTSLLSCSSIGKGMVEAYLEKQESVDTRLCEVWGKPFGGILPFLDNQKGKMKVLMVHGVGDHLPGYSTQFVEKLANELKLTAMSSQQKNIKLTNRLDNSKIWAICVLSVC